MVRESGPTATAPRQCVARHRCESYAWNVRLGWPPVFAWVSSSRVTTESPEPPATVPLSHSLETSPCHSRPVQLLPALSSISAWMCTRSPLPSSSYRRERRPRRGSALAERPAKAQAVAGVGRARGRAPRMLRCEWRGLRVAPRAPGVGVRVRGHRPVAHPPPARSAAQA